VAQRVRARDARGERLGGGAGRATPIAEGDEQREAVQAGSVQVAEGGANEIRFSYLARDVSDGRGDPPVWSGVLRGGLVCSVPTLSTTRSSPCAHARPTGGLNSRLDNVVVSA